MSNNSLSNELESLLLQSKQRWLRTNEIYTLLLNISNTNLRNMALNKLPYQPKSGDVFIISGDTQQKKWKNDGYLYLPRKNGVGFREDIEKLKIGGIKVLLILTPFFTPSLGNRLLLLLHRPTELLRFHFRDPNEPSNIQVNEPDAKHRRCQLLPSPLYERPFSMQ